MAMDTVLDYPTVPVHAPLIVVACIAIALEIGTGGAQTPDYYKQRGSKGYELVRSERAALGRSEKICTPAENLTHIRAVLRPAVTDIAHALGVSRQAVYDWQNGKSIAAENAARLADLARAADVFAAEGLTASPQLLRRPLSSGERLFEIVRDGGSAEDAARRLIQMVRRELQQRQILAARFANRKRPAIPSEDYGAPILDELG